jgi:hypothetical protein
MTTRLIQHASVRTNTTKDSVCDIKVEAIKFVQLWDNYVTGNPYNDPTYDNQCAIRLSATLHRVGVEMKSFSQRIVKPGPGKRSIGRILLNGKATATRADEMASWLQLQPFCGLPPKPENITGVDWEKKVRGRTGIIFFGGYWRREGETGQGSGGHIDLWNGERMTGFGTGLRSRWNIVIPGIWSDLNAANTILFFAVQ